MSIKEALERGSINSDRIVSGYATDCKPAYEEVLLEEGKGVLQQARIPTLLQELAGVIKESFPDVGITEPSYYRDFTVGMEIRWKYRLESRGVGAGSEPRFDRIVVSAIPFLGDLRIIGREMELLNSDTWAKNPSVIEDAVVYAYRNPGRGTIVDGDSD